VSGDAHETEDIATFTIRLTQDPTDDVTIKVISSDTGKGLISTDNVTFSSQISLTFNTTLGAKPWNVDQIFFVRGQDDSDTDRNQSMSIILGPARCLE